jgi:hypothetical protein
MKALSLVVLASLCALSLANYDGIGIDFRSVSPLVLDRANLYPLTWS